MNKPTSPDETPRHLSPQAKVLLSLIAASASRGDLPPTRDGLYQLVAHGHPRHQYDQWMDELSEYLALTFGTGQSE